MTRKHRMKGRVAVGAMYWSNPDTWNLGGAIPTTNDAVDIPSGTTIVLDVATASLGALTISGTLVAQQGVDVSITAASIAIEVGGVLQIGTEAAPYANNAVIELTGAFVSLTSAPTKVFGASAGENDGVSRGIMVEGSLILWGVAPTLCHTVLGASSSASASSFTLAAAPGWASGDQIVVGGSDYYNLGGAFTYPSGDSNALTLSGASSGTSISTTSALSAARYGVLQYATGAGMSLTDDGFTAGNLTGNLTQAALDSGHTPTSVAASINALIGAGTLPTVLDERAPVINTTRNIKIQGKDDTHWSTNGHGVHVMAMGTSSLVKLNAVEFKRCGQKGALGRYPIHWHMISYTEGTGAFVADVVGHVMQNCSVWNSMNRAITLHGTCGVLVDNNVCFDIKGHAAFEEDGSERRNTITNNVIMKVRAPDTAFRIKAHDAPGNTTGPTGFWLTNMDNTVNNNRACDCQGPGFWASLATQCFGNSILVDIHPNNIGVLSFEGNISHSNDRGMTTNLSVINDLGNTAEIQYQPTANEEPQVSGFDPVLTPPFTFHRLVFYKNLSSGYTNRVSFPIYSEWIQADNGTADFSGVTADYGELVRCLCIGTSLNSSSYPFANIPRAMTATYHAALRVSDCLVMGYPFVDGIWQGAGTELGGGMFQLHDLYIRGVEKGFNVENYSGNWLLDSNGGFRADSPQLDGNPLGNRLNSLACAIHDGAGIWTTAGRYWIYDLPYLTDGLSDLIDVAVNGSNGKSTATPFYSAYIGTIDGGTSGFNQLTINKVDNSLVSVGSWEIAEGTPGASLHHMRFGALQKGARFILTSQDIPSVYITANFTNLLTSSDNVIISLPFSNSVTAKAAVFSHIDFDPLTYPTAGMVTSGHAVLLSSAADRAAVESGDGTKFWQDTTNNRVWIKLVGGMLNDPGDWASPYTPERLYKTYHVQVRAA